MKLNKETTYNLILQNHKYSIKRFTYDAATEWKCCICGKRIYSKFLLYDSPSLIYCDDCYSEHVILRQNGKILKRGQNSNLDKHLVLNPFQLNNLMKLRQKQFYIINKK